MPSAERRPHDSAATKQDLLDAATYLFARHGYRGTGLRAISARAGTKTGNIHYHFGGKQQLYRQAFVRANQQLFAQVGLPKLREDLPAERALRAWLVFGLEVILLHRPKHAAGRMLAFELRDPGEALDEMADLVLKPARDELEQIVQRLLGDADTPGRRAAATDRVLGMMLLYEQHTPVLRRFGRPIPRTLAEVATLADDVTRFALGGIRAAATDG